MPVTRNQLRGSRSFSRTEFTSKQKLPDSVEDDSSPTTSSSTCALPQPRNDLKTKEVQKAVLTVTLNDSEKVGETSLSARKQVSSGPPKGEASSKQLATPSSNQQQQQLDPIDKSQQQQNQLPEKCFNILLALTGSVATIKMIELISRLKSLFPQTFTSKTATGTQELRATISIRVVMTKHSKHFIKHDEFEKLKSEHEILTYDDTDEWTTWKEIGDPVLHIELRKWADIYLIAPLDANTMAKLANGICDNLVTCIARAWDTSKPLVYCPAMNTHMYNHPITRDQLCKLQSFGYLRVDSVEKRLACGDVGMGGMASMEAITDKVVDCLLKPQQTLTLTKPLLNQQPTYPIMSLNELSPSKLPSATQLLNRIKPNNQLTFQNFNNGQRQSTIDSAVPIPSTSSNFLTSNNRIGFIRHNTQIRQPNVTPATLNLIITKKHQHQQDSTTGLSYSLNDARNSFQSKSSVIIPSLQNLKQIETNYIDCDDFGVDLDGDDQQPERFDYNLDPSKLLEQTLITDDQMDDDDSGSTQSFGFTQMTSSSDDGFMTKNDCLTPFFNTSRFLTLCQNKNKGCFTCAICKKNYKNRKSMARHLKEQHVQGNIYHCRPCGVSYKRKEKLIKHIRERHDGAIQQ